MADPRYILDTGPLVAFSNAADTHHQWAMDVLNTLGDPPVTCEIVPAEACYLLANSQRAVDQILALPGQGRLTVGPVFGDNSDFVRNAVAQYWPTMDVADGCVLQPAERFPRAKSSRPISAIFASTAALAVSRLT